MIIKKRQGSYIVTNEYKQTQKEECEDKYKSIDELLVVMRLWWSLGLETEIITRDLWDDNKIVTNKKIKGVPKIYPS